MKTSKNQMKNKIRTQSRIDDSYEGQTPKRHHRSVTTNRIQYNEQNTDEKFPVDQRPQKPPSIDSGTHKRV